LLRRRRLARARPPRDTNDKRGLGHEFQTYPRRTAVPAAATIIIEP
jgi:hypothetical protein